MCSACGGQDCARNAQESLQEFRKHEAIPPGAHDGKDVAGADAGQNVLLPAFQPQFDAVCVVQLWKMSPAVPGAAVVQAWYDQAQAYNFQAHSGGKSTANFTQAIPHWAENCH